jgi:hypothetical protein
LHCADWPRTVENLAIRSTNGTRIPDASTRLPRRKHVDTSARFDQLAKKQTRRACPLLNVRMRYASAFCIVQCSVLYIRNHIHQSLLFMPFEPGKCMPNSVRVVAVRTGRHLSACLSSLAWAGLQETTASQKSSRSCSHRGRHILDLYTVMCTHVAILQHFSIFIKRRRRVSTPLQQFEC